MGEPAPGRRIGAPPPLEPSATRGDDVSPPPGVKVRRARPADAASFLDLWRTVVEEERYVRSERVGATARFYRRRFRRSWTTEDASIVAVGGERVVGHLHVQREDHAVTRHVATLGLAILPEWRGRGVGSALMAEAIRWARSVGVEKLMLSVYPHNEAAIALYRKFGFVQEGRLARQSRKAYGYEDEILMSCFLEPHGATSPLLDADPRDR